MGSFDINELWNNRNLRNIEYAQIVFLKSLVEIQMSLLEKMGNAMNLASPGKGQFFLDEVAENRRILERVMNPPK
jgi:hypothetical protein